MDPPEFTLICHSHGGPATTVEWFINDVPVQEDSNHMTNQKIADTSANTVCDNTLRIRGRQPKMVTLYNCTLSNNVEDFVPGIVGPISSIIELRSEYNKNHLLSI